MKEPITAIGIIADINRRFVQAGKNLPVDVLPEVPMHDLEQNQHPIGSEARESTNTKLKRPVEQVASGPRGGQNHSGLELIPPEFDPALYEEPTGLRQCLEMIEAKYGLPPRRDK